MRLDQPEAVEDAVERALGYQVRIELLEGAGGGIARYESFSSFGMVSSNFWITASVVLPSACAV